jgi:hypothetical protein
VTDPRRQIYRDLGTPHLRPEPPSASSVTQHVLRGTLDTQVQADVAYTASELTVRFQLGPVFVVLKGLPAVRSALSLCQQLLPVLSELSPDLSTELLRQQTARAHLNGTVPLHLRVSLLEAEDEPP